MMSVILYTVLKARFEYVPFGSFSLSLYYRILHNAALFKVQHSVEKITFATVMVAGL